MDLRNGITQSQCCLVETICILAFILLHMIQAEESDFLPKNCTETYRVTVSKNSTRYRSRRSQTSCGIWGWGRCTVYRQTSIQISEYEIQSRERPTCCTGSIPFNETTCTTTCPRGMYGNDCSKNCTCPETGEWNVNCEKQTGVCSCKDGYHGENCTLECGYGYYGRNCSRICICQNNSTCSPINGICNCTSPGWTGEFCERECSNETFGVNCQFNCSCSINETCNVEDGYCTCKSGVMGASCDTECTNFTYGEACKDTCDCNKDNSMGCDPVDGRCLCKPGWDGQTCSSVCSRFQYGEQCSNNCSCNDDEICDHINGSCYSNFCYFPTTTNCDHHDDLNYCEGLGDFLLKNETPYLEYKLFNICLSLEKAKHNMVCLASSECQCRPGFRGTFCSLESQQEFNIQENKGIDLVTLIIVITSVAILVVCICVVAYEIRKKREMRTSITIVNETYDLAEFKSSNGQVDVNHIHTKSTVKEKTTTERIEDSQYDVFARNTKEQIRKKDSDNVYSHMAATDIESNDEYDVTCRKTHKISENEYSHMTEKMTETNDEYDVAMQESHSKASENSTYEYQLNY